VLTTLVLKYGIWEKATNFSLSAFTAQSKNNLQMLLHQSTLSCPKYHIKIPVSETKALRVKNHYDAN
jgi:hypothetical protein